MEAQPSFFSIDTFSSDAAAADAMGMSLPYGDLPHLAPKQIADAWTDDFARSLQAQHGRVRAFLESQRERWKQASSNFQRQITALEAEVRSLQGSCLDLQAQLSQRPLAGEPDETAVEATRRYVIALDDIRELKARNEELQKQLQDDQPAPRSRLSPTGHSTGQSTGPSTGRGTPTLPVSDWEAEKRRILAKLEPDDPSDIDQNPTDRNNTNAYDRCREIDEIVRRTDRIIAEKDREIEELRRQLDCQKVSLGLMADGTAASEVVLTHDEIVRDERARLGKLQDECRIKLSLAEIEIATERARLARREAELEGRLRMADLRNAATESEVLSPTGRPVRGRWRTQLGLDDDGTSEEWG